jgi:hypothetical protein
VGKQIQETWSIGFTKGGHLSEKGQRKAGGRVWTVLAIATVFVGGLFSIGAWLGFGVWIGLFLMILGTGFLLYRYSQTTIDDTIEDRARAVATIEERSFSELVTDALKEYLESRYPMKK